MILTFNYKFFVRFILIIHTIKKMFAAKFKFIDVEPDTEPIFQGHPFYQSSLCFHPDISQG